MKNKKIRMKIYKQKKFRYSKESMLRSFCLIILDAVLINLCGAMALWLRYDFQFLQIDPVFWDSLRNYAFVNLICTLGIFTLFKLYTSMWRFAGVTELVNVLCACVLSMLVQILGMKLLDLPVPRSFPFLYCIMLIAAIAVSRFSYRLARIQMHNLRNRRSDVPVRTLVVGAGSAGLMIVNEMKNSKHLNRTIPCIIDDDPKKQGVHMHGIPVVGKSEDIPACVIKYKIEEIVIAIPTLSGAERKKLLEICQKTGCKLKILPGIYQLVNAEVNTSMLRDVQIEDLLGREPVKTDLDSIMQYVSGRCVLVTGGGGSIGSELCRQIAAQNPSKLVIVDIYENNAYEIQTELNRKYPELDMSVLIASVRNKKRIHTIFDKYNPELVFHAAAHKHVPLMEDSPNEAVKNNVLGTWNVAEEADLHHVKKMVLISTDKAVRPTNVMGASKRICEMIIQYFSQRSKTEYAAVRFGNVLGSNGSVIPLFKKQIAEGGPVTVTDPEIIRYFMTIPEAVSLVLQAGAFAKGGEIFILDMGEPVKILDLAENLIRLSGYTLGEDMDIVITGLRPGEKLYEELLIDEANLR